jgi:hypothetical protein
MLILLTVVGVVSGIAAAVALLPYGWIAVALGVPLGGSLGTVLFAVIFAYARHRGPIARTEGLPQNVDAVRVEV